jgi:hypothetical protein
MMRCSTCECISRIFVTEGFVGWQEAGDLEPGEDARAGVGAAKTTVLRVQAIGGGGLPGCCVVS